MPESPLFPLVSRQHHPALQLHPAVLYVALCPTPGPVFLFRLGVALHPSLLCHVPLCANFDVLLPQVEAKPAPKELHGFELVQEQYLAEYNSQALLYRHKKTGACLFCW